MSDMQLFTFGKEDKDLLDNEHYINVVGSLIPLVQTEINKAFKPLLWSNLIEEINKCIDSNQFVEKSEDDENVYLFGVTAKFSPGAQTDSLHVVRCAMAFKKNDEGEIVAKGQLLVDITAQSSGKTSHSELIKFRDNHIINKYRTRGTSVLNKITTSLMDMRSLDLVYKHLLLAIQEFVVRIDGEENEAPFYMLDNQGSPVVSVKKFHSKSSNCSAVITASFESSTDEALLTSAVTCTCTTSTNDPTGNLQNLHTTVNVQHVLSAKV